MVLVNSPTLYCYMSPCVDKWLVPINVPWQYLTITIMLKMPLYLAINIIIYIYRKFLLNHTLSIWLQTQFSQRCRQIKTESQKNVWTFLARHDLETRGVLEHILSFFKVHPWLTYGWKSVRFWWYFHTFHENAEGVLLKFKL